MILKMSRISHLFAVSFLYGMLKIFVTGSFQSNSKKIGQTLSLLGLQEDAHASCEYVSQYKRIMVTAAHPDDIETIAGGTIAYFTSCGVNVSYVITTNGDKGWGKDNSMTSENLALIREQEQLDAAAVLNVSNVTFLRQEDGGLEGIDAIVLKKNITTSIRLFQPDLVVSFSPEIDYNMYTYGLMHEDHKQTAIATLNSLWPAARDYLSFYDLYEQGILPWITPEVWLFSFSPQVTVLNHIIVVNITGRLFEEKYNALLQHKSQYTNPDEVRDMLQNIGQYVSRSNLLPEQSVNTLAEAFISVKIF